MNHKLYRFNDIIFSVLDKRQSDDDWDEYPIPRHLLETSTDEDDEETSTDEDDEGQETPDFTSYEW